MAEAVRRCDRSRTTLQRALKAGNIDGAHREDPDDPTSGLTTPLVGRFRRAVRAFTED